MKRIFPLADVVYAAKVGGGTIANMNELDLLAKGAIAIFAEGALIDITAPVFDDIKEFYVAIGVQDSETLVLKSPNIIRREARVDSCPYVASVNERQFVGNDGATGALNFPGTLVEGTQAILNIFARRDGALDETQFPYRFEYTLLVGATNAIVLAGVKALIDAKIAENDPLFPIASVTIVGVNVGLRLDAKYGMKFQIGRDGIFVNSTIEKEGASNSLNMFIGRGLGAQVAALEEEYSDSRGNANKVHLPAKFFSGSFLTNTAINYDQWVISWYEEKNGTHVRDMQNEQTLILAVPDGAATFEAADFATTMAKAFDLTDPIETGA